MTTIILDRDGVINYDSEVYIKSPEEWIPIPGSLEAIAQLTKAGYQIVVATNQSGISRKLYDEPMLHKIHEKMHAHVEQAGGKITDVFYCPHHPDDRCDCRKPQPGLLFKIRDKYGLDLSQTFFVGDSIGDLRAAQNAGCKPVLVLTGNGTETVARYEEALAVLQFKDLAHLAKIFCELG